MRTTPRHRLAQRRCSRCDDARTSLEIERCSFEGRRLRQVDRVAALADEQLGRGDVNRTRRLQRADSVDTAVGEMAERDREGAEDPQPVDHADECRCMAGDEIRARGLEREDLDPVLGRLPVQRRAVQLRAASSLGGPLLPGAEVVDVAERTSPIVPPSATATESEKNGSPRFALIEPSIGSSTTPGYHRPTRTPSSSETSVKPCRPRRSGHDRPLDGGVDRGRVVAAHPGTDDRLPVRAGGQLREHAANVLDRGAAGREPVSQGAWKRGPR